MPEPKKRVILYPINTLDMKKAICLLLAVLCFIPVMAQEEGVPFNGLLLQFDGTPLNKRVKVWVKSDKTYATSDKKGRFGLTNVQPTDTIKFLYAKRYYAVPVEGRKSMRIRLADSFIQEVTESQELVDLGFGYVKRREFTGSSSRLSGEEFRRQGYTQLSKALQGRVPGLNMGNGYNGGNMTIRGITSIYGDSKPLILMDGTEIADLDDCPIQNVDYVEVLKDSNMYGVRGANGVILITTLKGNNK